MAVWNQKQKAFMIGTVFFLIFMRMMGTILSNKEEEKLEAMTLEEMRSKVNNFMGKDDYVSIQI